MGLTSMERGGLAARQLLSLLISTSNVDFKPAVLEMSLLKLRSAYGRGCFLLSTE